VHVTNTPGLLAALSQTSVEHLEHVFEAIASKHGAETIEAHAGHDKTYVAAFCNTKFDVLNP
jgi:hypothetical protein